MTQDLMMIMKNPLFDIHVSMVISHSFKKYNIKKQNYVDMIQTVDKVSQIAKEQFYTLEYLKTITRSHVKTSQC